MVVVVFLLVLNSIGKKQKTLDINYSSSEIIKRYAEHISDRKPTLKDYKDVNFSGVNSENINTVNSALYNHIHDSDYRYYVQEDYLYNFKNSNAKYFTEPIENSSITIKNLNRTLDNNTVFLKVNINTSDMGQYFSPTITLTSKGKKITHTFEKKGKGIRYLNVSSLNLRNGDVIKIQCKYMSLLNKEAEFIFFPSEILDNKRILVIAPHPDDAEIAAYGLYSKYAKNVYIITITAGEYGPPLLYNEFYKSVKERHLKKGQVRTLDSLTTPLLANVPQDNLVNLGFFDGTLSRMYKQKDKIAHSLGTGSFDISTFRRQNTSTLSKGLIGNASWNSLVENLKYLINTIRPDIIVTPYPALDGHVDHKLSSIAVFEALKDLDVKSGKLFLYTNHLMASPYYPYGEMGDPWTLPPNNLQSLYFNSILSVPMSKKIQADKIFALNSMSDMVASDKSSYFHNPCKGKISFICKNSSLLYRRTRDNELFFIVDINKIYDKKIYRLLTTDTNKPIISRIKISFDKNNSIPMFKLSSRTIASIQSSGASLTPVGDSIKLEALSDDPAIIINRLDSVTNQMLIHCSIESSKDTTLQVYYKNTANSVFNEYNSVKYLIKRGLNDITLVAPGKIFNHPLRVDFADRMGTYNIRDFSIHALPDNKQ